MPPLRSSRPVVELDPTLGDALSTDRQLAVSLIARADGGTDIIVRDRATGQPVDLDAATAAPIIKAHKRPADPPQPPQPPAPVVFPPVRPAVPRSFL